jgi:amidohydrolase
LDRYAASRPIEKGGPVGPKSAAKAHYESVAAELREISRILYANPELGFEEHESSRLLAEFLGRNGLEVEYPAWGLDTSFEAVAGGSGPEVVICAEYDALPEVGHACGHNIIATAACGAGVALAPLAEELGIRVRVLGTPAGAFETAAAAMMIHPSPRDEVDSGFLAVAHLDVEFHGKETHAAFAPELGINALDAAVQAYVNISTLRQSLLATDRVHGVVTYGGGAPNVIPSFTSMSWYVRSAEKPRLDELTEKVLACFEAAALATGCKHEVKPRGHAYMNMVVDPVMADLFAANSEALGRVLGRRGDAPPAGGSTDMGNVSHLVPTIHPMISINSSPGVNHQREFAAHTITPDGDKAIDEGAVAMAWTIIDLAVGDRWADLGTP